MFSWYKYLIVNLIFFPPRFSGWESFSDCAFAWSLPTCTFLTGTNSQCFEKIIIIFYLNRNKIPWEINPAAMFKCLFNGRYVSILHKHLVLLHIADRTGHSLALFLFKTSKNSHGIFATVAPREQKSRGKIMKKKKKEKK